MLFETILAQYLQLLFDTLHNILVTVTDLAGYSGTRLEVEERSLEFSSFPRINGECHFTLDYIRTGQSCMKMKNYLLFPSLNQPLCLVVLSIYSAYYK